MEFREQTSDRYPALEDLNFDHETLHDSILETQAQPDWGFGSVQQELPELSQQPWQNEVYSFAESMGDSWDLSPMNEPSTVGLATQYQNKDFSSILADIFLDDDCIFPDLGAIEGPDIDFSDFITYDESDLSMAPQEAEHHQKDPSIISDMTTSHEDAIEPGPWPSQSDWEKCRDQITKLYIADGKPLRHVMTIMQEEHGHKGTIKMYNSKINKWGLDKKNKAADMAFVLRTRGQREQNGKATIFMVRRKLLISEDITKYATRKLRQKPDFLSEQMDVQKPSYIEYGDPCSCSAKKSIATITMQGERKCKNCMMLHISLKLRHDLSSITLRSGQSSRSHKNLYRIKIDEALTLDLIRGTPRFPNAAPVVSSYIDSVIAVHTGSAVTESRTSSGALENDGYDLSGRFRWLITKLDDFPDQIEIIESGQLLREAFEAIRSMTNAQCPAMLQDILCAALSLVRLGLCEVTRMVLDFVTTVSVDELGIGHPWTLLCGLFGRPDSSLETIFCYIYQCATDRFANLLGTEDIITIRYQAGFAHDVLRYIDPNAAITRPLQSPPDPDSNRPGGPFLHLKALLGNTLMEQGRLSQALDVVKNWLRCTISDAETMRAWELLADIQFKVDRSTAGYAEQNIRRALKMAEHKLGKSHQYYVHLTCKLAAWLDSWNRPKEAEEIKASLRDLFSSNN